jgi:predicted phosphoribosyltransferase
MEHSLGNALAVEMRHLLQQVKIAQQARPARAGRQAVLIVDDGIAGGGGQGGWLVARWFLWHGTRLL